MDWSRFIMGAVPAHALPIVGRGLEEKRGLGYNVRPTTGTALLAVCITYIILLVGVQAYRAGRLAGRHINTSVVDILVFVAAFVTVIFAFVVAIIAGGLGVATEGQCEAAIRICVTCYGAGKIALYLFLLERVRISRAPFHSRLRDPVWIAGLLFIAFGFGGLVMYEEFSAMYDLSSVDGLCRIGITPNASRALMAYDTAINVVLTGLFVRQLTPVLRSQARREGQGEEGQGSSTNALKRLSSTGSSVMGILKYQRKRGEVTFQETVKDMLRRNVIGSTVILFFTLANNAVFLTVKSARLSHVCLLTCLSDVTWSVLVTNWLWLHSSGQPEGLESPTSTSIGSSSQSTASRRNSRRSLGGLPSHQSDPGPSEKQDLNEYALPKAVIHKS